MNMISDYDDFYLPANNMEVAKEFYKNKLGLDIKFDHSKMGVVSFRVGNNEPAIILHMEKNAKPAIWFTVDDVSEAYEKLQDKGIIFISEPFEITTGISVEFKDPFGNKLGLTDYSKMPELNDRTILN